MADENGSQVLPAGKWVRVAVGVSGVVTIQNKGALEIQIAGLASGASEPVGGGGAIDFPRDALVSGELLSNLFPGVANPSEIWAFSGGGIGEVLISHG